MEILPQNDNLTSREKETASLEALRQELVGLKRTEAEKKERDEHYNPHLEEFEPAELTATDLMIYQKFKSGQLSEKEFYEYQAEFQNTPHQETFKDARSLFAAWLANKVSSPEWLKRWHPGDFPSEGK